MGYGTGWGKRIRNPNLGMKSSDRCGNRILRIVYVSVCVWYTNENVWGLAIGRVLYVMNARRPTRVGSQSK
jgi:hypothetical protein